MSCKPLLKNNMKKKNINPKVTEVTYSRLNSTGQYENERLEIKIAVKSGDGSKEAKIAKKQVLKLLHIQELGECKVSYSHGPVCICDECM